MKYIITERQYTLLKEQIKKPIRVSSYDQDKIDDVLKKYCSIELTIPKQMVDKYVKYLESNFSLSLKREIEKSKKELGNNKLNDILNKSLDNSLEDLLNVVKNTFYAKFGIISSYNQNKDILALSNKIYENLISEFNFLYKTAARAFVTKKNVNNIKRTINIELDKKIDRLKTIFVANMAHTSNQMRSEFLKSSPKCTDVIIYNPYDKNEKPYNPDFSIKQGEYDFFDEQLLLTHLRNKIMPVVDSLV